VLTDFGIAKSLDPLASGLTVTGVLIGTPEYMAPEQITGSNLVDARADIYALGVLVYRALTGRRPFEGGTQEVLMGHLHGTPADPSSLDPSLPAALDAVVRKALARDPRQRYARAGEFAQALRRAAGLDYSPPIMRQEFENRAAVAPMAISERAPHNGPLAEQPTRRGTIVPDRAAQQPRYLAAAQPEPIAERRPARGSAAAWAILGLVLALVISGGFLYAAGLLPGGGTSGNIATAQPTEPPAPSAEPTGAPTAAPQPSAAATAVPTSAPTAAATAAPTSAPTAAPTKPPATAAPTRTPNPTATNAPMATSAPSATPTATSSPTETPKPTSDVPVAGGFKTLLEQNEGLANTLGAPQAPEDGGPRAATEQQFDNGSMRYVEKTGRIYVLFGEARGTFQMFERDDMEKLPAPPAPPEKCTQPMQGGFALLWGNYPDIQQQLGCPLGPEPDLFEGAYQPFEGGSLLWSIRGLGRGPTIYAVFSDHTFRRYKDPNQP
jgi:serine/threonine-protein kinase